MVKGIYQNSIRNKFEQYVTCVQFLLQAAMNRKTGANLVQLKTRDIQGNIKQSMGDYLETIKALATKEFGLFTEYFTEISFDLSSNIDEITWQVITAIQEYNLTIDFESRMVFYLQKLNITQLDAALKLLVLSHIKQRLERSTGLEQYQAIPAAQNLGSNMDYFLTKS
ncbi:MAG: hypothetical protein RBG13Loki_2029 [Promethearchaeota archaeon CR_4]|nr:MAG: hypothetical protein RBG13Loki_2029 [Candidatus Lokiarchaeota archaeon CR_4]